MDEEAKKIVASGAAEKIERVLTGDELWRTCIHEAGHAIVLLALHPQRFISAIVRSGLVLDEQGDTKDIGLVDYARLVCGTPEELRFDVAFKYGGYAAEKVLLGLVSSGQYDDLADAVTTVYNMVCQEGQVQCTTAWPPTSFDKLRGLGIELEPKTNSAIRSALRRTLTQGFSLALRTVEQRRSEIEALAQHLFDHPDVLLKMDDLPESIGLVKSEDGKVIGLAERKRRQQRQPARKRRA